MRATLADLTCDSDGKIDRFIDTEGSPEGCPSLALHELCPGEPYMLGLFLSGVYQVQSLPGTPPLALPASCLPSPLHEPLPPSFPSLPRLIVGVGLCGKVDGCVLARAGAPHAFIVCLKLRG